MKQTTPSAIALGFLSILLVASAANAQTNFQYETPKDSKDYIGFYEPSPDITPYPNPAGVKNVILLIGDGLGHNQITAARLVAAGPDGKLHMERIATASSITTHAANAKITDSAAAGTALACGIKTNNGMIGMDPDGKRYQTILQAAKHKGMSTGIAVTCEVTHATPAAFTAHVKSRSSEARIAPQLLEQTDVILGGGRRYFLPADAGGRQPEGVDLIKKAVDSGYTYASDAAGLNAARAPRLLGLFQNAALETIPPEPDLAELTAKAIEILSANPHGFFLMVEGSQIDWACHNNNIRQTIRQTLLFDKAVKVAVDFALRDRSTLILVTSDHETGGLSIKNWDPETRKLDVAWSTGGHTGVPVPLYALGPGARRFRGQLDNTDVPKHIAALLGIDDFPKPLD